MNLRAHKHPLVGPASQHCATIHGGAGLSTYAPSCTLEIERRTLPGETPEQVFAKFATRSRKPAKKPKCESCSIARRWFVRAIRKSRRASANPQNKFAAHEPIEAGVAYWMDAAIFAGAGMETVNYGGDGDGAHQAVEWADLDSVVSCAKVLAETGRRFCK